MINQALLLNVFVKISIYLLLPLNWSVHDTCTYIPPHPISLILVNFFELPISWNPDNSNCFQFHSKVWVIQSRLFIKYCKKQIECWKTVRLTIFKTPLSFFWLWLYINTFWWHNALFITMLPNLIIVFTQTNISPFAQNKKNIPVSLFLSSQSSVWYIGQSTHFVLSYKEKSFLISIQCRLHNPPP